MHVVKLIFRTVAQKLRRIAKPLRSLAVLSERSAVPTLTSRSIAASSSTSKKAKISTKEKDRLRRIARKALPIDGEAHSADVRILSNIKSDAWKVTAATRPAGGFGEEGMVKRVPKAPVTLHRKREIYYTNQVEGHNALEKPGGGTSYNPSAERHSKLIDEAYEEEQALLAREAKDAKRAKGGEEILAARRAPVEGEYAAGMTIGEGEAASGSEVDGGGEDELTKKTSKRKTQAQRNKAARLKAAAQLVKAQALQKKLLKSIGGSSHDLTKAAEEKRVAMAEAERLAKFVRREKERMGLKGGEKIGKWRVGREKVDVQLGEDLAETLRQIKVRLARAPDSPPV